MLSFIGVESIEDLLTETIPEEIRLKDKLESNTPLSEYQFLKHIQALSNKNKLYAIQAHEVQVEEEEPMKFDLYGEY